MCKTQKLARLFEKCTRSFRNDLPIYAYLISTVLLAIVVAEIGLLVFALWLNIAEQQRGELPLCLNFQEKVGHL